jgi:hypothetical protein
MPRGTLIAAFGLCAGVLAAGACGKSKPVGLMDDAAAGTGGRHDAGDAAPADHPSGDGGHDADGSGDAAKATATLVKAIALPGVPVATAYNGGTKKAYFACRSAADAGVSTGIAVVDDATNTVVARIDGVGLVTQLAANATTRTVYAAEADQVDVIDSATDTVQATFKTPDGSLIAGVAVDETHNLLYIVARKEPLTGLYALDGAPAGTDGGATDAGSADGGTTGIRSIRNILLIPAGAPAVAVDEGMQRVFVMGADSNGAGLIVAFDGVTGVPQKLAASDSLVSATASGVVALGNGEAAALFLGPNIIKRLNLPDVKLPADFTPTGIARATGPGGGNVLIVGFGADGGSEVQVLDASSGVLSPLPLSIDGTAPAGTVAAGILTAAPLTGGTELYVDESDKNTPPTGLPETLKVDLQAASH